MKAVILAGGLCTRIANETIVHEQRVEPWKVTLIGTGICGLAGASSALPTACKATMPSGSRSRFADTLRNKPPLEGLWGSGKAAWRAWK